MSSDKTWGNGLKLPQVKFRQDTRKLFFTEKHSQALEEAPQGSCQGPKPVGAEVVFGQHLGIRFNF